MATFAARRIDANTDYAVVVSRLGTANLTVLVHVGGNDCQGNMFQPLAGSGFEKLSNPEVDMLVTVLVG